MAGVVLIESLWPQDGQSTMDLLAAEARAAVCQRIRDEGEGWRIPPPSVRQFDLGDEVLERSIEPRSSDQPAATFNDAVNLQGDAPRGTYVLANDRDPQPYASTAEELATHGWRVLEISGGHSLMITQTDCVARLPMQAVGEVAAT